MESQQIYQLIDKGKKIDINLAQDNEITDISNVKIDSTKNSIDRIIDFLLYMKNPYLYKVNDVVVQIDFADNSNITALECISTAMKNECQMY